MSEAWFGLIGVIVGGGITIVRDFIAAWHTQRKNQKYLAIRVATYLDYFAERCIDDNGVADQHGALSTKIALPTFDLQSLDVEWKSIAPELMFEVLSYSSHIDSSNNFIRAVAEFNADPPLFEDLFEERQFQYAKLGLKAIDISDELKEKCKVPKRIYNDWHPRDHLIAKHESIERFRNKRAEESKRKAEAFKARMPQVQNDA